MTKNNSNPHLKLIQGNRLTSGEFSALELKAKIEYLHDLSGSSKLAMILAEPQPASLIRALPPEEIYRILHDVGPENSLEIFRMARIEQIKFIFDWELWDRWTISAEKTVKWLQMLFSSGEERAVQILSQLDQELLLIFLKKSIVVGGGLGDVVGSEDLEGEWDHTFDEIYFIRLLDIEHDQFILQMLDLIYRENHALYQSLMMGVENEFLSELEEQALHFRNNRLADEGFPSAAESAGIYSRIATEGFKPGTDKIAPELHDIVVLPPALLGEQASFFSRAFAKADSPALRQEFRYLTNSAVAAEGITPADHEKMVPVLERISNYLNIALEYLCTGAEDKAVEILQGEHLTRLFSLGYSLLLQLQERAKPLKNDNYATDKLLMGLSMRRPRFYRGLDPDTIDNYREFAGMDDIRKIDSILKKLEANN
jgi:hypothetical protein